MSDGIELSPDASAIAKLSKGPIEVKIGIFEDNPDYKESENPEENAENIYVQDGEVTAWLHPLTWTERDYIKAEVVKVFRFWKEQDGSDKTIWRSMVREASNRLVLFYALRLGPEKESPRLFKSQEEILDFHPPTLTRLNRLYYDEFSLTDKERGNLLRARSLKTSSVLPAISPAPTSSDKT